MRTLIRYLVFFGVLVGIAFALVSVEIGGETLYRRYRMQQLWPRAASFIESTWVSWRKAEEKKPERRAKPKVDRERAKERVAILRRATEAASPEPRAARPKQKTRVDPHISPKQKKALDELVTSRVGRR